MRMYKIIREKILIRNIKVCSVLYISGSDVFLDELLIEYLVDVLFIMGESISFVDFILYRGRVG